MSDRNAIQRAFDSFARSQKFEKRSGSWYRRSDETIQVLNLQKSQYGQQYYVNIGIWLLSAEDAKFPKEQQCHIRTRLTLVVPEDAARRLESLLDLQYQIAEDARYREITGLLTEHLAPLLDSSASLEGLRSGPGRHLVGAALLRAGAQQILSG